MLRPVENAPVLTNVDRLHRRCLLIFNALAGLDLRPHHQGRSPARSAAGLDRWRRHLISAHEVGIDRGDAGRCCWRCTSSSSFTPHRPGDARARRRTRIGAAGRHPRVAGCWRSAGAWRRPSARWPA
ncbi:MAG: hypothetical protein MZV49_16940 [Rhodopseudomonas palustris]|nr:hypothetical protein [Rhodopseudomonas palustris]